MKEYVISGHSGETEETFKIPYNVTLIFYADPSTSCYVPNTKESLPFVILTMRDSNIMVHTQGDIVNNYEISFTSPFEGLAEIHREVREREKMENGKHVLEHGKKVYEDYYHDSLSYMITAQDNQESITLEDFCNHLSKINNRGKITIFCVFCRGSRREFQDIDFGVENMEEPFMESMDDEDFSMLLSGGKKKIEKKEKKSRRSQTSKTKRNKNKYCKNKYCKKTNKRSKKRSRR